MQAAPRRHSAKRICCIGRTTCFRGLLAFRHLGVYLYMKRLFVAAAIALAGFTLACGDGGRIPTSPMAPSPVPPGPAPPLVVQSLYGYVSDTAFRPVTGAKVEVLTGPQAGTVMTSDDQGRFSYTGTFASTVNLRATKEGFAVATQAVFVGTDRPYAFFNLI